MEKITEISTELGKTPVQVNEAAGFVVNRGGATCADVLALVDQVKERVLAQTGVELEMEVKVLK